MDATREQWDCGMGPCKRHALAVLASVEQRRGNVDRAGDFAGGEVNAGYQSVPVSVCSGGHGGTLRDCTAGARNLRRMATGKRMGRRTWATAQCETRKVSLIRIENEKIREEIENEEDYQREKV
jgi:hypothetical protein